jgi:hypothetical protein
MDDYRTDASPHHPMESVDGCTYEGRSDIGDFELRNLETNSTLGVPADPLRNFDGIGGTTTLPLPSGLDNVSNLYPLHGKDAGRSFIAMPNTFDRKKENYRRFRRQFGLFLTANRTSFKEKESMIWFVLSYMKGGDTELWANAYVDKALENNDWGVWEDFLDKLAKDFGNKGELRKALEELGRLQQNKRTATEYFLKLEQLADVAGVDLDRYSNTTLYVERNVQRVLIDQLYQTDNPPTTYRDYKRKITAMDEMRQRREPYGSLQRTPIIPKTKDTTAMDVDRSAKKETRRCFICAKEGHLARTCLEKKLDF